jgi:hypothetical protein
MRKQKVLQLAAVIIGLFTLIGSAAAQEQLPRVVAIATNPIGSFFHATGVAAAKVITEHTKMKAVVKPMSGSVAWYPYMERGEMELGVLNMWDAEKGYLGESMYEKLSARKGFSIRLISATIPNSIGFIVGKDSKIRSMADLKGKRVAGNYPTPSIQLQTEACLANANLTLKDVTSIPANSPPDGVRLVMDGRADASAVALGTPVIDELNAKKGALYLPFDSSKESADRMKKIYPGYMMQVKPGPGNTGVEKEQSLWTYDIYLIAHEKLSDDAVYTITKALWENTKDFPGVHKLLSNWTTDRFVTKNALVPYHTGAIKFYKEKGVWNKEMDALQKELLAKKK